MTEKKDNPLANEKLYWLAIVSDIDNYGTAWKINLHDGPHSNPSGVAQALKIIGGLTFLGGLKEGEQYAMVTVQPVPDLKVKVNQDALNTLNEAAKSLKKR